MKVTKVIISRKTILFTVFLLIGLVFLYYIRDLILEVFVAILVMTLLSPIVNFLVKFKIPRTLAVIITYLVLIGALVYLVANLSVPLIEQTTNFVNGLPKYLESLGLTTFTGDKALQDFLSQIGILPASLARFALSLFSNLVEVITVLIFALYMLITREDLDKQVAYFFEDSRKEKIISVLRKLESVLGRWIRGQLILMFVVGAFTYIGLKLLGVPYTLPLAILAGLLEIVPYVGPVIAAIPVVIIGFGMSTFIGIATIALAFLVQQVENYVFVPVIMNKSVGVSPLMVLLSLAIGFRLFGIVGAIVSIPAVLALQVLIKEYSLSPKKFV
jgi:predicted PurR-regulated permease PerM